MENNVFKVNLKRTYGRLLPYISIIIMPITYTEIINMTIGYYSARDTLRECALLSKKRKSQEDYYDFRTT